jgi:hypothetical protein
VKDYVFYFLEFWVGFFSARIIIDSPVFMVILAVFGVTVFKIVFSPSGWTF